MGLRANGGSPALAVPGEMAQFELTVENTADRSDDVWLEVRGEAAAWGWITPPHMTLGPGERSVARVTLTLPRAPYPPAGPLSFDIAVLSSTGVNDPITVPCTLEVVPFADVYATIDPPVSRGRAAGRHLLTVENRGNARLSAGIEAEGEELSVRVEPDRVEAEPGQSVEARVAAKTRRQLFRAGTTTRTFAVTVRPHSRGRPWRAEGTVEVPPAGWLGRVALALLAVAVAAVGLGALFTSPDSSGSGDTREQATSPASAECPGRDHLSPDANGIVRPDVKPAFDYTFLFVEDGCKPARFNPCAPIRYTLNRRLASDADVADLEEALRKTSAATGLEFVYAGTSNENPLATPRPVRGPDGSLSWPPVHIGWAHLGSGEALRQRDAVREAPDVVVGGGGLPVLAGNVITTGSLVLNLDAVTDTDTRRPVPHGFGTGVNWGRIMLHELAHVIGLGHVESRTSIMNEALTQQRISSAEWGVGDLIGLRHLGREAGCLDVPPPEARGAPR